MTLSCPHGLPAGTGIKQSDLAIPARRHEQVARGVERQTLNRVTMATEHTPRVLGVLEIPQLHDVIAGGACKDVVRRGVEQHLANPAW